MRDCFFISPEVLCGTAQPDMTWFLCTCYRFFEQDLAAQGKELIRQNRENGFAGTIFNLDF